MQNQQISLKPQDIVVLLKLILEPEKQFSYASIGGALFISQSEVHASVARSRVARLIASEPNGKIVVVRGALRELILHGAQFVFPAVTGPLVRGVPTAHASPALHGLLVQSEEPPPVWPYAKGTTRGIALQPLYPTVPRAAEIDSRLYDSLALFDALRIGRSRERSLASEALGKLIA